MDGEGKKLVRGTGGDGSQRVRERLGMDVKDAGTGGDGTEIPSPCRPGARFTKCLTIYRKII